MGAGGLNEEVGGSLARKGTGCLKIFDHDTVELSNLDRQRSWEGDLYKNRNAIYGGLCVGCGGKDRSAQVREG